jgi:hypothetical protein
VNDTQDTPANATAKPTTSLRQRAAEKERERQRETEASNLRERAAQREEVRTRLVNTLATLLDVVISPDDVTLREEPGFEGNPELYGYADIDGLTFTIRWYHGQRLHLAFYCPTCLQTCLSSDIDALLSLHHAIGQIDAWRDGRTPCPGCKRKAEEEQVKPPPAPRIDDGGPAFPASEDQADGISTRDYFAAKAMQGFCVLPAGIKLSGAKCAADAYAVADAMLSARKGAK